MPTLDPRQKAERIIDLFRGRRPTEIWPAEVCPASEAYAIRRAFQEIEEAKGRGAIAGYKVDLTTAVMQKLCGVEEPCYAIFAREVIAGPNFLPASTPASGPKPRSRCDSAMTCRKAAIEAVSPPRLRAQWRPSS